MYEINGKLYPTREELNDPRFIAQLRAIAIHQQWMENNALHQPQVAERYQQNAGYYQQQRYQY